MLTFLNQFRILPFVCFDGDGGSGGTTPPATPPAEPNQEDLNKQFADRAARAAEAERKKILEGLGVTDLSQLENLLKVARDAEDKTKTETEKLQKQIADEKLAREKAEKDAQAKTEAANKRLVDSDIRINAASAVMEKEKVLRPAFRKDALDDVLILIDRTKIELTEDGTIKNVSKALDDLAKAKPYLLEQPQQPARGTPREQGQRTMNTQPEQRERIIRSL